MSDTAALAALIVAAVALLIASAQLTQQLLSTAYVIRKCDRIVTGGLTRGGTRHFHWRQFRFTVKYQTLQFALPLSVYASLDISSTVQPEGSSEPQGTAASNLIVEQASKTRPHRSSAQACWVSLVQDLAFSACLVGGDIGTKEESGDRIPDDLTVAPMRVDSITLLLTCIAMGMQVFKYSPTTGEITLSGGLGSVSSSAHPLLGGLLHYSVFSDESAMGLEVVKTHARALRGQGGVWANAVFGRFMDLSYRPQMVHLAELMERKLPILRACGWPENSPADRIGGAACFMVFGDVDVSISAPPSVIRPYSAHFAEVIVRAHHMELSGISQRDPAWFNGMKWSPSPTAPWMKEVESLQFSTPHWYGGAPEIESCLRKELEKEKPQASRLVICQPLIEVVEWFTGTLRSDEAIENDKRDPSTYCPIAMMWDLICIADMHLCHLYTMMHPRFNGKKATLLLVARMIAVSISKLAHVGPPSWGDASLAVKQWPQIFMAACNEAWLDIEKEFDPPHEDMELYRKQLTLCAELSTLRSAYYTVMMRAAHPLGPGLVEGMSIETSLAYMA
ncbi:MAG: hypothetical protein Q9212_006504 [Teloschistes hypoglaucus]